MVKKDIDVADHDEVESTFPHDDSDVDAEQEKQYDQHFWPNNDMPQGYSFKSKKQPFRKSLDNIKISFKRGSRKKINEIEVTVKSVKTNNGTNPEIDVEIFKEKENERGNAILRFYGPNNKKEQTLLVSKSKKHDFKFVKIIAEEVMKPLIDTFISGEGWTTLMIELPKEKRTEQFECTRCAKTFVTDTNLGSHMKKFHENVDKKLKENKNTSKVEIVNTDTAEDMNLDVLFESAPLVAPLPKSVQPLVNFDDVQYLAPGDGACAAHCASIWLFRDTKFGPKLRGVMCNHMADRWDFYKEKVSFPYERKVGVQGKVVKFQEGQEKDFLSFLRSEDAPYLWVDSEDIQVIANLYQISIKVISIKDDDDPNPTVNFVGPDPEMEAFRFIPPGKVPEMVLLHYGQKHYNLIISSQSDFIKKCVGSDQSFQENKKVLNVDTEKMDVDEDSDMQLKYNDLIDKYKESQDIIKQLKKRIDALEKKEVLQNLQVNNAFEKTKSKDKLTENEAMHVECTICKIRFPSKTELSQHASSCGKRDFSCSLCELAFGNKEVLKYHNDVIHGEEFNCELCSFQTNDQKKIRETH